MRFGRVCNGIATYTGKPVTFFIALGVVLIWAISGSMFNYSDTWQLIINTGTTIMTFLMVFLIQNSQNRDSLAIQAKLDELLHCMQGAREDLEHLEEKEEKEIIELRR